MRKLAFASRMVNQILIRGWLGWSRGVVEPLKLTLPLFFLMASFTSLFEVERAGGNWQGCQRSAWHFKRHFKINLDLLNDRPPLGCNHPEPQAQKNTWLFTSENKHKIMKEDFSLSHKMMQLHVCSASPLKLENDENMCQIRWNR